MKPPPRIHRAVVIGPGQVSSLCYENPHARDLTKLGTTTTRDEAVTCQICRAILDSWLGNATDAAEQASATKEPR